MGTAIMGISPQPSALTHFHATLTVDEHATNPRLTHIADDLYHDKWKSAGAQRTTRKTPDNRRAVSYSFKSSQDAADFTAQVKAEYAKRSAQHTAETEQHSEPIQRPIAYSRYPSAAGR